MIRFAKLLGFAGFQALKIALAQKRATADSRIAEVAADDDTVVALNKLDQHYREMFDYTTPILRKASFQSAVDLI